MKLELRFRAKISRQGYRYQIIIPVTLKDEAEKLRGKVVRVRVEDIDG